MTHPANKSWRVRKISARGCQVSPPYESFLAAQISARNFVEINRIMNRPAFAQVVASIAEPQIKL